eukprot:scaffold20362_cov38-Prasinocladus_malaysianus.AAC.1
MSIESSFSRCYWRHADNSKNELKAYCSPMIRKNLDRSLDTLLLTNCSQAATRHPKISRISQQICCSYLYDTYLKMSAAVRHEHIAINGWVNVKLVTTRPTN